MHLATVVIEKANATVDTEYDYFLPEGMAVQAGCRVVVPFGSGNQNRIALVLKVWEGEGDSRTTSVL